MLDLSPTKLIIIFVVVIVLLGPKRLPQVARQLGAGWRKLVGFQQQVERELRESMPDLPSSQDIVRFARSPVSMLNHLAEFPSPPADAPVEDAGAPEPGEPIAGGGTDLIVDGGAGDGGLAGRGAGDGALAVRDGAQAAGDGVHPATAPAPAAGPAVAPAAAPATALQPPAAPRPSPERPWSELGALVADDPTMN